MGYALTERDEAILRTLACKVRYLTLQQVAATWWRSALHRALIARRRLRLLREKGLLEEVTLPAHPMLPLAEPIVRWRVGDEDPPFDQVAYRLQQRWAAQYRPTRIFFATARAARHFGAVNRGRILHPDQITHDLHVSALYLKLLKEAPELAAHWVGEDEFAKEREGEKLPDAVLRDGKGPPAFVVEFGGRYDASRLRDFHEDCRKRMLPYDLW